MTIAQHLSAPPDQSLASIYEGPWGGLYAAYRFYDNPAVIPEKILAPLFEALWARSGEQRVVLIARDTTYFNYSTHKVFQGGGAIERLNDQGILPQRVPLGLAAQKIWARDPAEFRKARQEKFDPGKDEDDGSYGPNSVSITPSPTGRMPDPIAPV